MLLFMSNKELELCLRKEFIWAWKKFYNLGPCWFQKRVWYWSLCSEERGNYFHIRMTSPRGLWMCMGSPPTASTNFTKGYNFYDFLFVFPGLWSPSKMRSTLRRKNLWVDSFIQELPLVQNAGTHENSSAESPESEPIHIMNYLKLIKG